MPINANQRQMAVSKLMQPELFDVLYIHGQLCIFGGCFRKHPYPLDNLRISPVGLLHGAAATIIG